MSKARKVATIDLVEAAARLRLSYHQTLRLVLKGVLAGERRDGRWYVAARSLKRLAAREQRQKPAA